MLQDEIDRYLVSLVTTHVPQTVTWYRKRLAPLRQEAHPRTVNSVTAKSDVVAIALDLLLKQDNAKS